MLLTSSTPTCCRAQHTARAAQRRGAPWLGLGLGLTLTLTLTWPGLAWPGLAWPGLAWPGWLAWLAGLAWHGLAWPGLAGLALA